MTGLPQSKVRFYEKHGLVLSDRQENGYRVFTPEDAFRSNAFRTLLQYGFSIDEAVAMLDAKQGTEEFERSLLRQQEKLRREADLIAYRLRRLDSTLGAIKSEPGSGFELVDAADQVYINSSHGRDFRVSLENERPSHNTTTFRASPAARESSRKTTCSTTAPLSIRIT